MAYHIDRHICRDHMEAQKKRKITLRQDADWRNGWADWLAGWLAGWNAACVVGLLVKKKKVVVVVIGQKKKVRILG